MVIDEAIKILGPNFRGLWRSTFVSKSGVVGEKIKYAVTYAFKNTMVETENHDTPIGAFKEAIEMLKDHS